MDRDSIYERVRFARRRSAFITVPALLRGTTGKGKVLLESLGFSYTGESFSSSVYLRDCIAPRTEISLDQTVFEVSIVCHMLRRQTSRRIRVIASLSLSLSLIQSIDGYSCVNGRISFGSLLRASEMIGMRSTDANR